ncbi:DnaA N-terminal domain-containing protein [Roseisolibacter agri]|uniref:DnaA N-terminal domain-containing protein n=1 Tax=Roseisolibacter agri TaxID=2014610 RepID=UPI0024E04C47|nr:DnaA N-terminal domain-containing protein [Roseisolibacter agri]
MSPVPVAFHLLELVRPLLYPDPTAVRSEYTVRYPNGLGINVELHGNTKLGLLALFDLDVYFATRVIAADRGRGRDEVLSGVSLREIGRVLGVPASQQNGEFLRDVMASLDRLSGFRLATDFDFAQVQRAVEASAGRARPFLPEALPRRVRPKRHWHFLLQVGLDEAVDANSDGTRDVVGGIRFDPVWLDSVAGGATAWVDFALYRALSDRYAKLLYQTALVRILRHPMWSAHEPWEVSINDLLRAWGVADVRTRTRRFVADKLPMLQEKGVFGAWREVPGRGDGHRVVLEPGERLLAARTYTGVRAEERPELARLVWALQHGPWRFSLAEARYWAEANPRVALRVLQRAVYLCDVGWEPKSSWSGWVKDALKEGYEFEFDARYAAWLDARLRGYPLPAFVDPRRLTRGDAEQLGLTGRPAAAPPSPAAFQPVSDAGSDAGSEAVSDDALAPTEEPEVFEPTLWGRVRARLAAELDPRVYRTWLQALRCGDDVDAERGDLQLEAPDGFSAEWIGKKFADRIAVLAAELGGAPVRVVVGSPAGGPVIRRAAGGEEGPG